MITVDGSAISVAATACALALVDAGVELKAFPATSSVAVLPSGSILIGHPKESAARATVRVTNTRNARGQLAPRFCHDTRSLDPEELEAATSAAAAAALSVRVCSRCVHGGVIADPTALVRRRAVKKMVRGMARAQHRRRCPAEEVTRVN